MSFMLTNAVDVCAFNTEHMLYSATNNEEFQAGLNALCENESFSPAVHNFCQALSKYGIDSFFSTKLLKQILNSPILTYVFSRLSDDHLNTPLHHIAYNSSMIASNFGLERHEFSNLLAVLAENTNSINAENVAGSTPLHEAADSANSFMVRFLSHLPNLNPNANNAHYQNSPLHLAVVPRNDESDHELQKRDQIVQTLLRHPDINPNTLNEGGDTPAHYAVRFNNLFALQALANHTSTDLCIQNLNGNTPAHLLVGNEKNTTDGQMYDIIFKTASNCLHLYNREGLTAMESLARNYQYGGVPYYEVDKEIQD